MSSSTTLDVPRETTARDFAQWVNNRPTSTLTQQFLSPSNQQFVAQQIANRLSCLTGQQFIVPVNQELQIAMQTVLQNNYPMWTSDPKDGLAALNQHVIESETHLQGISYRNHLLYDKYFITQNRQRVEERPAYDVPRKGETLIDLSEAYQNQSPWRKQYPGFLQMFAKTTQPVEGDWPAARTALKEGCTPQQVRDRYNVGWQN